MRDISISNVDRPRVLLVEDEAAFAAMLRYNLETRGFLLEHAANGQEALSRSEVPAACHNAGLDVAGNVRNRGMPPITQSAGN